MITFVSDIRSSKETNILAGNEHKDLVLVPLASDMSHPQEELFRFSAPESGWNHEELTRYADLVETGDAYLASPGVPLDRDSSQWVGGSEV